MSPPPSVWASPKAMSWMDFKELMFVGLTPIQQWRVTVALALIFAIVHMAWFHGIIFTGPEYATPTSAASIARKEVDKALVTAKEEMLHAVNSLHSQILEDKIQTLHFTRCNTDDPQLKESLSNQISQAMSRHRRINNYFFPLTPCTEM